MHHCGPKIAMVVMRLALEIAVVLIQKLRLRGSQKDGNLAWRTLEAVNLKDKSHWCDSDTGGMMHGVRL